MANPKADNAPMPTELSWLDDHPPEMHDFLQRFGVAPHQAPRAAEFNRRLIELKNSGLEGPALIKAIARLQDEVIGDGLTRDAMHELLEDLELYNDAGAVEYILLMLARGDHLAVARLGSYDMQYMLRSMAAVADSLDAVSNNTELPRETVSVPPPIAATPQERERLRSDVHAILREQVEMVDQGRVRGIVAIVLGPTGGISRFAGSIPLAEAALYLRELREKLRRTVRPRRSPVKPRT